MRSNFLKTTKIIRVEYNFETRIGCLFLGDQCCCDMTGCVDFFTKIDDRIVFIKTMSGSHLDVCYVRRRSGEWKALLPDALATNFGKTIAAINPALAQEPLSGRLTIDATGPTMPEHYPDPEAIIADLTKAP